MSDAASGAVSDAISNPAAHPAIDVRGLVKRYGERAALELLETL